MRPAWLFVYPLVVFCKVSVSWGAKQQLCSPENQLAIEAIEISGNSKTDTKIIEGELNFRNGDTVCVAQIHEGIGRIERTGLFSAVDHTLSPRGINNSTVLRISVSEKWTTIPIVKINSGGGISQYTLGVYDPNVFGKFMELGGQYEHLGGAGSGVLWFKNPRLFGGQQGLDLQYWNTRRVRIKYDQNRDDPEIKQGFLHIREKFYADYFREVSRNVVARVSFDYNDDSFSTKSLPGAVREKLGLNPILPPSTELVIAKLGLEIGKIDGPPQKLKGQILSSYFAYAHPLDRSADPFLQGDLTYHLFLPLSRQWQFAQRLLFGASSTKVIQYWYYLGGLDRIRGFADNRFAGNHFALSNSEARYLLLDKSSFLVQGTGFVDFGAVGDQFSSLTRLTAASVGSGLRVILPKFYRFVIRLDYAKPILKNDGMNWSFGVQQFF